MNTDDKIMELVNKHGFKLPDGLESPVPSVIDRWYRYAEYGYVAMIPTQQAHDLCAMAFARQIPGRPVASDREAIVPVYVYLQSGNSAAAINALWEAMQ